MKKVIFILMLIATTLAAKQSNAQARPVAVRNPLIRPSAPGKPSLSISHQAKPPALIIMAPDGPDGSYTTTESSTSNGVTTVTTTTVTNQSDKSVPPGTVISQDDHIDDTSPGLIIIIIIIILAWRAFA